MKEKIRFNSKESSGNIWYLLSKVREVLRKQQRINDYNDLRF